MSGCPEKPARFFPTRERQAERNNAIRSMHEARRSYQEIAREYGLSAPRCHQIVRGRPHDRHKVPSGGMPA
jgi:Mor family transcriptional regulator